VPLAFGGYFLFREATRGHWPVVAAIVAAVLLFRFWPAIVAWFEQRWRQR
jgi:TRAP-type C4-dicarboxylate transport system permease large subunit